MPSRAFSNTKARQGTKDVGVNQVDTYYFDVEKCKHCPLKEGCYKDGAKTKTYSVSIKSELHQDQMAFQETEYYKEKAKHRYKIEAKNSELKIYTVMIEQYHTVLPYANARCNSNFYSQLKRILKLM